ncbi:neurochondrin homolog [Ctenocephalides felis]|uniref:neurochondrin homolog n=1 Tax=Ctenocephalides felis TaxID=7515 RepID=UPI000E6E3A9F|nr:neurochondrin homolog [Ctenocephalides felis]XP_026480328.1 neurochondrin homolog [Ctenocephalides felis]
MADSISEPVKKCILILQSAKTDTEKFAALFMVTKLVKGKDCTTVAKKALFEAIGFKFLKKLLLSADVPEDCPPLVYKSVALSILTCFCQDEELATHKEMLENIPVFLDIVQTADDDDYDDNLIVVSEAYSCLQSIASYEPGQKALLEGGAIGKMSQIYAQQSFQTDEALNLIVTLVSKFGPSAWDLDPKNFHALLNRICLDFETDHTERKFTLCSILGALLFNCRRSIVGRTADTEVWPGSLFKGLSDILGSRIGKNQRDPALKLASAVIDVLGVEWTLRNEENPKQFFLLLLQLSAIEVRMQMDDKSLKQALANGDLISACFIILELSVAYMANDTLDLEQKEKQTIYTALKGAFSAVISVLTKVSNDKNKDKLPPKEKSFVCAMVRVLAVWLATETSAMRTAVYALLPYMLQLANDTFYAARTHRLSQDKNQTESDADVLRMLLPALCHLAVEDRARDILLANKQDEVLYECMVYHWSIAHYKKPPIPKADRLKALSQPEAPLDPQLLADMKDSRAALVSLCNIFMNITVLEAKTVEESALFGTLLKFIFSSLPELRGTPENLVLQGHLAVLGLLLLKAQHKKLKKNDFSICSFIQSSIRFLWDAYNLDESNDPFALVVSLAYKEYWMELMELWFLGMQTMSSVLPLVPWISDFAVESGWAEGIVTTLKKVRIGSLQADVKSAYEDFLCHLVDANKNVIDVLKKADALKVCRNHRLMELGKKLFGD